MEYKLLPCRDYILKMLRGSKMSCIEWLILYFTWGWGNSILKGLWFLYEDEVRWRGGGTGKNSTYGSFHAKQTTGCQVTPSDFTHIHTICSSTGRMNTQKKSVADSLRFWKYSSSKICPDPPFFASARCVIDLSDLWPAFIPVCNKIHRSKLLPGVISSHILRIWSQKHCTLFSFYAKGT